MQQRRFLCLSDDGDADRAGEGAAIRTARPNEETVAAMRETRSGKLPRFEDADALMKQGRRLNAPRTSVYLNNRLDI